MKKMIVMMNLFRETNKKFNQGKKKRKKRKKKAIMEN